MDKTEITILDDSRVLRCDAGCGIKWSKKEELEMARKQIKSHLLEAFTLEYLDLAQQEVNKKFTPLLQKAKKANLQYPLLIINGDIRISGDFDLRMLSDMIDAARELDIV